MSGPAPAKLPTPRLWRVALGFLVAPLAGGAAISAMALADASPLSDAFSFAALAVLYGGYPPALVLGIPAYLALRRRVRPRPATLALAGGTIAILPWLWAMYWPGLRAGVSSQVGNCVSEINGATTWCGHLENAKYLALIFAAGAVGGLAFWLCAAWRDPNLAPKAPAGDGP